jgi:hypothetical protein
MHQPVEEQKLNRIELLLYLTFVQEHNLLFRKLQ